MNTSASTCSESFKPDLSLSITASTPSRFPSSLRYTGIPPPPEEIIIDLLSKL